MVAHFAWSDDRPFPVFSLVTVAYFAESNDRLFPVFLLVMVGNICQLLCLLSVTGHRFPVFICDHFCPLSSS
jgi:hypothetical protein